MRTPKEKRRAERQPVRHDLRKERVGRRVRKGGKGLERKEKEQKMIRCKTRAKLRQDYQRKEREVKFRLKEIRRERRKPELSRGRRCS